MTDAIDETRHLIQVAEADRQAEALKKLKQAVAESSISTVAKRLEIPRCTLSLVVNDKYPANPKNILAKFEAVFGGVECPHLAQTLTREQCRDYASKGRPSNPLGLQHWRACQNCTHKGA